MRRENPKERRTSDFIYVNGIGTVMTDKGCRDVFVYGYFTKWDRWSFIVHQDVRYPDLITVSEASTGHLLRDRLYSSVEEALYFSLLFIEEKHYYFATAVGNLLVKTRTDLLRRNTTNLQTLAIDTIWL